MRTYDSKINSFGFDLRYTDNTMLDTTNKALKSAYRRDDKRNLGDNPWVSVCVHSGDRVTVPNPAHRIGYGTLNPSKEAGLVHQYAPLNEIQFGLEVMRRQISTQLRQAKPFKLSKDARPHSNILIMPAKKP